MCMAACAIKGLLSLYLEVHACFLVHSGILLRQLAGKQVGRGKCGPNQRKVGHLECLLVRASVLFLFNWLMYITKSTC